MAETLAPMKPAVFDRAKVRFPLDVTPKIDGWRVRIKDGVALSASGEPLRNPFVQDWARRNAAALNGLDGEIVVGKANAPDVIRKTAAVNKGLGTPDFTFHAFDRYDQPNAPYAERRASVARQVAGLERTKSVPAVRVTSLAELDRVEAKLVSAGFEGAIARKPDAPYKFGRSTTGEAGMLKIKRFSDAEARIVGVTELVRKDGTKAGTLGALKVERGGVQFEVGTGFTDSERAKLWSSRDKLDGQLVKFKHMEAGAKTAPRHPVFLAIRDKADMTEPVPAAKPKPAPRAVKPSQRMTASQRLVAGMSGADVQAAPTAERAASNRMISGMSGNPLPAAAPASKGPAGWSDAARAAAAEKRAASASSRMIKGMSGKGRLGAIVALTVAAGSVIADAMGSDAMAKEPQKKPTGPSGNTVKVKQAEAAAKAAEAQAKEAEARTKQIEAETRQKELDAAAKERADKMAADQAQRTFDVAVNVGAYGSGMIAGGVVAKGLDKKFTAGLTQKNAALDDLAEEVSGLVDKRNKYTLKDGQRMRAVVKTADKVGLTKTGRGPAGPVFGGGLIALGATSRALAAKTDNETVATILNATGSAEMVAGATVVVKDLANRASTPAIGNVKALAKIEQARAVSEPRAPRGQSRVRKSSTLSKISKTAGKLALPVAVVGAALIAAQSAASAGESNTDAAKEGAKAGADVLTGGAISEFETAKAQGASDAEAAARGTAIGVINTATFGVATMAENALREKTGGGVAEAIANPVLSALGFETASTAPKKQDPVGDAMNGAMEVGLGSMMLATAKESMTGPGARAVLGVVGTGLVALGAKTIYDAVTGGGSEPSGKAYLNDNAKQKAEALPSAPAAPSMPAAPKLPKSDGRTESYTRVINGKAVQVSDYSTPKK